MTVNMNDVAEKAGVSISTVSRVINGNYPVKKETREKIEKVIEELGYKPNIIAQSLKTKKTFNIAIVVPNITNPFFTTVGEEIIDIMEKRGFVISLFSSKGSSDKEKNIIENIIARGMDGIIAVDPSYNNIENGYFEKISQQVPFLLINGSNEKYKFHHIFYDEEIGTNEAFNLLKENGHDKILFIRGNKSLSYDIKEDLYYDFIKNNSIDYKKVLTVGDGNNMEVISMTKNKVIEVLKQDASITSIFACNDMMAVGALEACRFMNQKVPEDISIIGFDNTLLSKYTSPKLTTVDLEMKKVGQIAAEKLLDIINEEKKDKDCLNIRFKTSLIERHSTGKVKEE